MRASAFLFCEKIRYVGPRWKVARGKTSYARGIREVARANQHCARA